MAQNLNEILFFLPSYFGQNEETWLETQKMCYYLKKLRNYSTFELWNMPLGMFRFIRNMLIQEMQEEQENE